MLIVGFHNLFHASNTKCFTCKTQTYRTDFNLLVYNAAFKRYHFNKINKIAPHDIRLLNIAYRMQFCFHTCINLVQQCA